MNTIKPFRGITYNISKIDDISKVLTPPYDIIDEKMQKELYEKHPANFIRIDFGKRFENDNDKNNVYTRAKNLFNSWLKDKIFIKDEKPCFYFLIQDFSIDDGVKKEEFIRTGFFGLYKLSDFSTETIMPHEKTQSAPKEDRYLLTKACQAYFSAIFSIYEDNTNFIEHLGNEIISNNSFCDFIDYQGVRNRFYKISDEKIISQISHFMKNKTLYIADGHHRYETALRIAKEYNNEATSFTLMFFSNMCSKSMKVLPTHRLIHNIDYHENTLKMFLSNYFDVEIFSLHELNICLQKMESIKNEHAFSIISKNQLYLIKLKNIDYINDFFPVDFHKILKELDVNILFHVILKGFFRISQEDLSLQKNISYTKDVHDALQKVQNGDAKIAFILNPTETFDIKKVASIGETMPQKSTFFYPKTPSGLVIYSFNENNF